MKNRSKKQGRVWFVIILSLLFFVFVSLSPLNNNNNNSFNVTNSKSCSNRYIYIHNLPPPFNHDVLQDCKSLTRSTDKSNMCTNILNSGFGRRISNTSWYATNQFLLEVIFHNRMNKYECLTNDSTLASAIFVPFYAGLDLRRHLWRPNAALRDSSGRNLVSWLRDRPEWKRMMGRDHFLVSGRISRDFMRNSSRNLDWGSNFMLLPETRNMSILTIEASSLNDRDFAVPYPTNFHPSKESEVIEWQERMRRNHRDFLFSFAGAPRQRSKTVRSQVISQCIASNKTCKLLDCNIASNNCDDPVSLMKLFGRSVFCLQPVGDSYTRRSIFDSILAGCIPVFFHKRSAYDQYKWHLPKRFADYSVFIPENELSRSSYSIQETLLGFTKDQVIRLRDKVIDLIPNIIYMDPNTNSKTFEDAFDIALKEILQRVKIYKG